MQFLGVATAGMMWDNYWSGAYGTRPILKRWIRSGLSFALPLASILSNLVVRVRILFYVHFTYTTTRPVPDQQIFCSKIEQQSRLVKFLHALVAYEGQGHAYGDAPFDLLVETCLRETHVKVQVRREA